MEKTGKTREQAVMATSWLNIGINILLALIRIVVGLMASSIAIISEGINGAADALTSVLALVGTKLAGKHPDEKHPFGYGRIEYLTSLMIATLILVTGVETLINAVKLIFHPEELSISYFSLIVVAVSAVCKFFLGVYTMKVGKKADSGVLYAIGLEGRNDSFVSVITITSALIFLFLHFSIDAYVGVFTSLIILKAGIEVLMDTVSSLLGKKGDHALAETLYKEIRATDGILGAADMMLHNYGPDAYSGSVNIEIDHTKTIGEVYESIHRLQLRIMHEHKVTMVFGIYAVDADHEEMRRLRLDIAEFARSQEKIKSYHAVYFDKAKNCIYCDFIVEYSLRDWDSLENAFTQYMEKKYPDTKIELTIETEYV